MGEEKPPLQMFRPASVPASGQAKVDNFSRSAKVELEGDRRTPLNIRRKEGVHNEATGYVMPEEFSLDALLAGKRLSILEAQRGALEGSQAPRVL